MTLAPHRRLLPLLLLPLLALPVTAQDVLPEIMVQAPGEDASQAFVGNVLDSTHGKQLARWHQPVQAAPFAYRLGSRPAARTVHCPGGSHR